MIYPYDVSQTTSSNHAMSPYIVANLLNTLEDSENISQGSLMYPSHYTSDPHSSPAFDDSFQDDSTTLQPLEAANIEALFDFCRIDDFVTLPASEWDDHPRDPLSTGTPFVLSASATATSHETIVDHQYQQAIFRCVECGMLYAGRDQADTCLFQHTRVSRFGCYGACGVANWYVYLLCFPSLRSLTLHAYRLATSHMRPRTS
jgi:hypothetical protein